MLFYYKYAIIDSQNKRGANTMLYTDYEYFESHEDTIDRYFADTSFEDVLDVWDEDFAPFVDDDENEFGEIPNSAIPWLN